MISTANTDSFTPHLEQHPVYIYGKRGVGSKFGFMGWSVVTESNLTSFLTCKFQSRDNCSRCTVLGCVINPRYGKES